MELQRSGIVKAVLSKKTQKPHRLKDGESILVVARDRQLVGVCKMGEGGQKLQTYSYRIKVTEMSLTDSMATIESC